jgi:hypothetical protein
MSFTVVTLIQFNSGGLTPPEAPLKSVWHFRSPPASRASSSRGGVPAGNGPLRIFLQHMASTRHEQEKKHSAFLVVSLFYFYLGSFGEADRMHCRSRDDDDASGSPKNPKRHIPPKMGRYKSFFC